MSSDSSTARHRQMPIEAGVVRLGELYTLRAVKDRLGLKDAALRSARKSGLQVRRFGGRAYILGDDLIAFITKATSASAG